MNKLRRKLLKFSFIGFFTSLIPNKSLAFKIKNKKIKNYNKKFKGFVWYLDEEDQ